MKVHDKIRSLREAKNWSQEDMAAKLNMSINGYSKIERGETKAHIPKLEQIAEVFDMDLIELIPLDGKNVYLFSSNNNGDGCHIFNTETEVVFENEKLQPILETIKTAKKSNQLIKQNLAFALFYNLAAVPFAMMGYIVPLFAALAMSSSSIVVVVNALRIKK